MKKKEVKWSNGRLRTTQPVYSVGATSKQAPEEVWEQMSIGLGTDLTNAGGGLVQPCTDKVKYKKPAIPKGASPKGLK